ncbi:glycosyltransferase [Methylobacterium sp. Leaf89]|uniref:glycosyltransferase n=1 Tax=Methylobacterium sp. Leaf89 TaxID=1736245 RepID=UPI0009EBD995|nr:glycosyltransferase [Methylobacterium sp. Leaf89]
MNKRKTRIFWLGMHKVLTKTELPALRQMGYEVFAPPYLSDIIDQSSVVIIPERALSTLPADVFSVLSQYNFYYNSISDNISEILNEYFDCIIVTINPDWLGEILKKYRGKVIYRTYGQPYSLSKYLENTKVFDLIDSRDNFWFSPHLDLTSEVEDTWLRYRMKVIPYALENEILDYKDTWRSDSLSGEIGLLCPRIDNAYYADNFRHIKHYFPHQGFPIFGAQVVETDDPQVVGTIDRTELLKRFQRLNGFLYHYKEPTVTYLPPIEVMMIGGPVIHFPTSLIGRLFEKGAPGAARDEAHALEIAKRLQKGDWGLMREMVASQIEPRRHYDPLYVRPKFEAGFREMIDGTQDRPAPKFIADIRTTRFAQDTIFIPFHRLSFTVNRVDGHYTSGEGIVRVLRLVVKALIEGTNYNIVISSKLAHATNVLGFFHDIGSDNSRVRVIYFDEQGQSNPLDTTIRRSEQATFRSKLYRRWRKIRKDLIERGVYAYIRYGMKDRSNGGFISVAMHECVLLLNKVINKTGGFARSFLRMSDVRRPLRWLNNRKEYYTQIAKSDYRYSILYREDDYVRFVNERDEFRHVFIPHYYFFPEAVKIKKRIVMYLPDHMPSIMPAGSFEDEIINNAIGRALVARAAAVMTNSYYSAAYLPRSPLKVPSQSIHAFPLPKLNRDESIGAESKNALDLPADLQGDHYKVVFYPTQNRPNKQLKVLAAAMSLSASQIRAHQKLGSLYSDLALVLTCASDPEIVKLAHPVPVFFLTGVSDSTLANLYKIAVCLCFTSVAEGNFPTQLTEALNYRVPIVATRMPLIETEIGEAAESLILCNPGDISAFAAGIIHCLGNRPSVIANQEKVRALIEQRGGWTSFKDGVIGLFQQ